MVQGVARRVEELQSIDDCTEEVIFLFLDAFTTAGQTPADTARRRYDLPDKIREVIVRATELPRPEVDPGSPHPTGLPAQPA